MIDTPHPPERPGAARRRARWALLAGTLAVLLTSCAGADEKRSDGERVFADSGCAGCHTLAGAGASGKAGPDLDRARPSVSRIVRQVKRGGNGMPAFGDKLSDREIVSLAQYVDSVAGRKGPVVTAFKPDGKRPEDCRSDATMACWDQALGNLIFTKGTEKALETLARTDREAPAGFSCHRAAHSMGAAALARAKGEVARAFVGGSPVCASGFYHGVLERSFAGLEDSELAGKARELCADRELAAAPFLQYQCLHGLGHGLMIYTSYEMPLALKTCDALENDFGRQSCAGGVFMENFNTSYGAKSEYLREDDLIYPCNEAAPDYKYACYQLVTARIRPHEPTWKGVARQCRRSEPEWVPTCFESMGRDVSGEARRDPARARRSCRAAGSGEADCLYGVVREIANADGAPDRAAAFCAGLAPGQRPRCFTGLGSILVTLFPAEAERRRACAEAAGRLAAACEKGAGVTRD